MIQPPATEPGAGGGADEEVGAGQRRGAEDRPHLGAEAAAGDQHQPFDHLRELVGELERDAAAEAVADQGRAVVAEGDHQVAQAARQAAEAVVAAARRRLAVAGEIGRDHGVVERQRLDHRLPVARRPGHAVDEQQQRPLARLQVADGAAVDGDRLNGREACIDWWHGEIGTPPGGGGNTPSDDFNTVAPQWRAARRSSDPRSPPTTASRAARSSSSWSACSPTIAAALLHRRRRQRRSGPPRMGPAARRSRTPKPVAVPGSNEAKMQLVDGKIQATGDQRRGLRAVPRPDDGEDRQRRADRRRHSCSARSTRPGADRNRPEQRRAADALPALLRRRASTARRCRKKVLAEFASHGHLAGGARSRRRPAGSASPRSRA